MLHLRISTHPLHRLSDRRVKQIIHLTTEHLECQEDGIIIEVNHQLFLTQHILVEVRMVGKNNYGVKVLDNLYAAIAQNLCDATEASVWITETQSNLRATRFFECKQTEDA